MASPVARAGRWVSRRLAAAVRRLSRGKGRRARASYDAAQTTDDNKNHWAWADSLNANAAHDPATRRLLRERARYERDNNAHCGGLVEKVARDLVGTGPRLQLTLPATFTRPDPDFPGYAQEVAVDSAAARAVEKAFAAYARKIALARKLRTMHQSRQVDGECFGVMVTNPALDPAAVRLDLRLYETDQVTTPFLLWYDANNFDGGKLDDAGNVTEWHLLKVHPGSDVWVLNPLAYDAIPAGRVLHWYKARRPGQLRGVPEITAALPLFAYLRRYTLASVAAAEIAANYAAVLTTDQPPPTDTDGDAEDEPFDRIPAPRAGMVTLPGGYSLTQLEAQHPAPNYRDFKGEILTETGATLGAPRNVSTGSSAEYNYSSGRLDHLPYERMIGVLRSDLREVVLDPLFREWAREALLVAGLLPADLPPVDLWAWEWHYDGFDSIDPLKDAQTDAAELANNTTTLAEIYARKGKDWEEAVRQRAKEVALLTELGLPTAAPASPASPAPAPAEVPADAAA